jgi:formamidopyrimidine-DNA glycosylase
MPELPEVETVRRQLAAGLEGMTFLSVEQVEPFMMRDCRPEDLFTLLPDRRVERVDRLGKFLIVVLDGGVFLTLHLGMTGQLLMDPGESGGHTRFVFTLRGGAVGRVVRLEFRDMRKFGRLHLGPDAWIGEWDAGYLARRLRGRSAPLKAFLLDQRHLAGIGNIYADEILWWTALSPLRPAGSLADEQVCCLADEIRTRLAEGVRLLGCTLSDFVDTEGRAGSFQDWLQAYGRQGLACRRCGGIMARAVVGGRGTSFCPGCQR